MKYLFPFDVFVSLILLLIIGQHTYQWTDTSLPVIGAVILVVIRLVFCVTSLAVWNSESNTRWSTLLSAKDYNIEIPCSLVSGVLFTLAGFYLWSWFYIIGTFLLMWTVSQVIELTWVFAYSFTHNNYEK